VSCVALAIASFALGFAIATSFAAWIHRIVTDRRQNPRGDDDVHAEWRSRHDFAEFAEALDVSTLAIMAVHQPTSESVLVLYSPDVEHDPRTIFKATLRRGVDGVLFVSEPPHELRGLWEDVRTRLEREFGDD
jgi:NAD(P)-dependent dehydrogenase (short-subunit alcohol dehydrogenase family)